MVTVTISFTLEKVSGPFVSKDDLAEALAEQATEAYVDESEYEVTDWAVVP